MEREIFYFTSMLSDKMVFRRNKFFVVEVDRLFSVVEKITYRAICRLFVPQKLRIVITQANPLFKMMNEKFRTVVGLKLMEKKVVDQRKVEIMKRRFDFGDLKEIENSIFEVQKRVKHGN